MGSSLSTSGLTQLSFIRSEMVLLRRVMREVAVPPTTIPAAAFNTLTGWVTGTTSSVASSTPKQQDTPNMQRQGSRPRLVVPNRAKADSHSITPGQVSGMDFLRDPKLFKGMAFTLE